jgi:hypothetical protein
MSANQWPVADAEAFCAKPGKHKAKTPRKQKESPVGLGAIGSGGHARERQRLAGEIQIPTDTPAGMPALPLGLPLFIGWTATSHRTRPQLRDRPPETDWILGGKR